MSRTGPGDDGPVDDVPFVLDELTPEMLAEIESRMSAAIAEAIPLMRPIEFNVRRDEDEGPVDNIVVDVAILGVSEPSGSTPPTVAMNESLLTPRGITCDDVEETAARMRDGTWPWRAPGHEDTGSGEDT